MKVLDSNFACFPNLMICLSNKQYLRTQLCRQKKNSVINRDSEKNEAFHYFCRCFWHFFGLLLSRIRWSMPDQMRSKTQTMHSGTDLLCEAIFWENKRKSKIECGSWSSLCLSDSSRSLRSNLCLLRIFRIKLRYLLLFFFRKRDVFQIFLSFHFLLPKFVDSTESAQLREQPCLSWFC